MMNQFLEEILEQPKALEKTLNYYTNLAGKESLKEIQQMVKAENFEQIIFTGMGSSNFTSFAAANIFNKFGIASFAINASELLHYNLALLEKKTLLICTSQSGESFEVIEVLKQLPTSVTCIGITNVAESTLAKKADVTLFSQAGNEDMTSTKTYVSISLVSYVLAWSLAGEWTSEKIESASQLINNFKNTLTNYEPWIDQIFKFFGEEIPALQIIARGACFSTASQSALMFKEATKIPAAAYLGGEFRHGPMEMVQKGFNSILFAADGKTIKQNLKMAQDIADFGGKVLLITNSKEKLEHENVFVINVNQENEYLFSIESIISVQLYIDYFAKKKGFEAGSFAHGAKVTAVE